MAMSSSRATDIQGLDALLEAATFLQHMRFSPVRGDFAEGKHVAILIDPNWNEDRTISVLIACRALGHRPVDWRRLAVWVEYEEAGERRYAIASPMDARGHTCLPPLPSGEYSLSAGSRAARKVVPQPRAMGYGAMPYVASGAEVSPAELDEVVLSEPQKYFSLDGKTIVSVSPLESGICVAAETKEQKLSQHTVRFAFVEAESGKPELTGETVLQPVADDPGVLEGIWQGETTLSTPCRFVFHLVSGESQAES
jgi:hypothetical protein